MESGIIGPVAAPLFGTGAMAVRPASAEETLARRLGDDLPALCWISGPGGDVAWCNRRWVEYTGLDAGALAGRRWLAVCDGTAGEAVAAWDLALASGSPFETICRLRGADGVDRPFLVRVAPRVDGAGAVAGWIGLAVDIASRVDAEADLRRSEERFRTFLESTRDGVVIHDGSVVLDCTDGYARMFGYGSAADLVGRPVSDLVAPEALAAFTARYASRSETPYEVTARRKDGSTFPAEFVGREIDWQGRRARVGVARDLTDRRRAEALLEERAAVLGQLVEGVVLADADGRIVYVNEAAARLHGLERVGVGPEDYAGAYNLLTQDGRPYPSEALPLARAVLHGETVEDARWRIRRPDGTEVLAIGTARPITDGAGRRTGAVLTLRDDTVRHDAEAALRESEERFRQLADSVDQVFYILQMGERRLIYVSPAYERVWGRSARPILEDIARFVETVHPADRQRFREEVASRETGRPVTLEYRIIRPDGEVRWIRDRSYPVVGDGRPLRRAVGVAEDVTERKHVEASLQRLTETLADQVEARTRERNRVWELSRDLFASARFDGYLEAANPAWTAILGHDIDALLSRPLVDFVHPEDRRATLRAVARLRRTGVIGHHEARVLAADGSIRFISWSAAGDGERFYAVGRDITREKQREEQLRQVQKMEAVGQLTGGIAHDFNNLLMVVSAGLDMLERITDPGRRERILAGMRHAVDRGSKLSRQLLAFSRRQSLRPEPTDVARRVAGMRELLERSLRGDITVAIRFPEDLWAVEVDAGELELVLLNLAVNARDAMPDGGTLTISARNVPDLRDGRLAGDFVCIDVSDTGVGMPPDVLSRAFEPFFTTKEVGKGSGLGLAQTHGFAEASGGRAAIRSQAGLGTTVSLLLPRTHRAPVSGAAAPPPETDAAHGRTGRVLLVEDDDEVAALCAEMFRQLGFETLRVAGAAAALGALADGRGVDLMFSDIMMPGTMNGVDLAREVRRRRPDLPILLTSGYAAAVQRGSPSQAFPLLQKPYRLSELSDALARLGVGTRAA